MQLNRNITITVNFILDHLLPPLLRDSRWFMVPVFRLLFGKKAKYYLAFKDQLPTLSDSQINDYYEILADTFINRDTDLNRESIAYISQHVIGDHVLDVASGRGFLSEKLARQGHQLAGVDIRHSNDKRNSSNPFYIIAGITQLPFPENHFDTVVCAHTLEHIRDIPQAISEIRRVCKKRLIIVVPCQREYKYTFDLHIHFFPYEYCLRQLVGTAGDIVKVGGDFIFTENLS